MQEVDTPASRPATGHGTVFFQADFGSMIDKLGGLSMTPEDAIEQVVDAESFLRFVEALESDRRDEIKKEQASPMSPYSRGHNGWENGTIESFLEAARAWAKDTRFSSQDWSSAPGIWRGFAKFLLAGKFYE